MKLQNILKTALLGVVGTGLAFATSITTPVTVTGVSSNTNDAGQILVFNKFDTSLGTLTSVHFILAAQENTGFSVTEQDGSANDFTFFNNVTVSLSDALGGPIVQALPSVSTPDTPLCANCTVTSPGGLNARTLQSSATSSEVVLTDAPTLSLFCCAPGTINLTTSAHSNNGFNASGDVTSSVSTRYIPTVTLSYDYTPTVVQTGTPEPATFALFGSALVGLGFIRRRSTKK